MKLDLGGMSERIGFTKVGLHKDSDIIIDLNSKNWNFKDNSIDEIRASHILEHMEDPYSFLNECYRIMKPNAIMLIKVPHSNSKGSFGCMEHRWHFNEYAIQSITTSNSTIFSHKFKLISTKVKRGRFLKWQKREIYWTIQKQLGELNNDL